MMFTHLPFAFQVLDIPWLVLWLLNIVTKSCNLNEVRAKSKVPDQ